MPANVPAVWITDGHEAAGWMDLNRFLGEEKTVDRWQVLYCLLTQSPLVYQDVHMYCANPIQLLAWMRAWESSVFARRVSKQYSATQLPRGLQPFAAPHPQTIFS